MPGVGGEEVRLAFIEEIARLGLKGKVDVMRTGCHGFCERGPVVVLRPKEIFYQQVGVADVPEVVAEDDPRRRAGRTAALHRPGHGSGHHLRLRRAVL